MSKHTDTDLPPELLEEADFDRKRVAARAFCTQKAQLCCPLAFFPQCWPVLPFLCCETFIFGEQNAQDRAEAEHLYLTRKRLVWRVDGHDKHCRARCCYTGRIEKSVPLDRIQDIEIVYPGKGCVDDRYGLMVLRVQTAGSSGTPEINVAGLRDVKGFKARVLAQKEAFEHGGGIAPCYSGTAAASGSSRPDIMPLAPGMGAAKPDTFTMSASAETKSAALNIMTSLRRLEALLEPSHRYHKLKLQQEGMM